MREGEAVSDESLEAPETRLRNEVYARQGVSREEAIILFTVVGDESLPTMPRRSLAAEAASHFRSVKSDSERTELQTRLERAIDSCMARGWLFELTAEDVAAEAERWQGGTPMMFVPAKDCHVGGIELTGEGFRKLQAVSADLSATLHYGLPHDDRKWAERKAGLVEIISETDEGCRATIRHLTDRLATLGFHVTRVEEPVVIGAWWRSRYELVRSGFRVWLHHDAPRGHV